MRETLHRLWFTLILVGLLGIVARNIFGQPPMESSLGKYPLPRVVGMTKKPKQNTPPPTHVAPITLEVWPKIAVPNLYVATTFHIRWKIEPHADNRAYTLVMDCGEYHATSHGLDGDNEARTRDRYDDFVVGKICVFQACVVRVGGVNFCDKQIIATPEEPL